MNTRKVVLCYGFGALCFFGLVGFVMKSAQASTVTDANAFRSVSLLGQNILMTGGAKFNVIDMDDATGEYSLYLPDPSSNDGLVYFVKRIGSSDYGLMVYPGSGDTIEEGMLPSINMYGLGEYRMLIADSTNDTWWVIGNGGPGY